MAVPGPGNPAAGVDEGPFEECVEPDVPDPVRGAGGVPVPGAPGRGPVGAIAGPIAGTTVGPTDADVVGVEEVAEACQIAEARRSTT